MSKEEVLKKTAEAIDAVNKMAESRCELERLCGEIIATIVVNRERKTLVVVVHGENKREDGERQLDGFIEAWKKRLDECRV